MKHQFKLSDSAYLWSITLVFIGFGLLMVFDTSALFSLQQYGTPYHFLFRQTLYAGAGLVIMAALARTDYGTFRKAALFMLLACTILSAMVFIPGIGRTVRGARRWIALGPLSVQPSEFAKLVVVYYLAAVLSSPIKREKATAFWWYAKHIGLVGIVVVIVLLQRDLGTTVIIAMITFIMFFLGGIKMRYLLASGLCVLPLFIYALVVYKYRLTRVFIFLDPWKDPYGAGFQLIQSLISFGKGGVLGQGFANGKQQLFYLPDAHTDFILSVIGEELGLLGVVAVLLLFFLLLIVGVRIAVRAQDRFGFLLASGITFLITLQVVLNVAVVMGMLPTKGMVLPFLSYGGSALITNIAGMGILLSIAKWCVVSVPRTQETLAPSASVRRSGTKGRERAAREPTR